MPMQLFLKKSLNNAEKASAAKIKYKRRRMFALEIWYELWKMD